MNKMKKQEKEITGYKLKEEFNEERIKSAISYITNGGHFDWGYIETSFKDASNCAGWIALLIKARVFDLWFDPIYKEEEKKPEFKKLDCIGTSCMNARVFEHRTEFYFPESKTHTSITNSLLFNFLKQLRVETVSTNFSIKINKEMKFVDIKHGSLKFSLSVNELQKIIDCAED